MDNDTVLVSTMNDVPGYKVVAVHGEVFGLICRARNAFSNMGTGLRTIFGGEVSDYTQLSPTAGNRPSNVCQAAMEKGGNAVLAMRFDCNEIVSGWPLCNTWLGVPASSTPRSGHASLLA